MLTLKNIRTLVVIGLSVLLIAGTAVAKNARASQRQAARGQRRQARASQRQAKQTAKAEQRQAKAAQRQANNQARRQATAERREAQQAGVARIRTKIQTRRRTVAEKVAAQRTNAVQRRANNQARIKAVRQVKAAKREQKAQNRQIKVVQRTEQREQKTQERAARNLGETSTVRNGNRQRPKIDAKRDVVVRRNVRPGGATVTRQRTVTRRSGSAMTKIINTKFRRDIGNRFRRPSVVRRIDKTGNHRDRDHKSIRIVRRYPGRRSNRLFRHIIWRNYGYPVYYRHGPSVFVQYVRPAYHRKYVFVSFGTYWPVYYSSLRYYWYGLYPYSWYGCYPTAYGVSSDTYNYYTYNTYNYGSGSSEGYTNSEYTGPLEGVDETTFEDVRQKLEQQRQQQPNEETLTDKFFEDGVTAFEQGDYDTAAKAFADAIALEPDDLILPFAYVQALFASEQYSRAADNLRSALEQMPAEEQGLFFPRGLYSDDEILFGQIDELQSKAETFTFDPDMSLLLSYQLVGVERNDEARQWLERAGQFEINEDSTVILFDLLNKLQEQSENTSENNL
jgi:hypothetical protein